MLFMRRTLERYGLLLCALVVSLLSQSLSGCGNAQLSEEPAALASLTQNLTDTTCVTFQRGSVGAVSDAHVSSHQPELNSGALPELYVGQVGRHTRYGLLHFDTSPIPAHATITSATLSLWRQGPSQPSSLTAHAVTHPWQEASVSWSRIASGFAPQVAASAQTEARPGALSFSLRELVATWTRFPSLNQGLLLQQSERHSLLASSEHPDGSRRPTLHVCYFLPDSSPDISSAPSLLLRVLDDSGRPVSGAAVSVGSSSRPTDGAGYIVLDNLPPGSLSARVQAVGFAPAVVSLHLPPGARASHQLRLQPLGPPQPFMAEKGATLERGAVRVTLPANAVVDADGYPVSGSVQATLVPLDPSSAPASALPGPLEGLPTPGSAEPVPLESFLMAEVSLWQDGRPLQLAPGATATLELLLPASASSQFRPGDTIPAWWLDTERGVWVREGTGTVQASSSHPGRLSWVVQVNHFTWWNCDAPLSDRSCVDVLVKYTNGLPAPGIQVGATGVSYSGYSRTAYTGSDGRACVEIKRGATARVFTGVSDNPSAEATVTGTAEATACGGTSCTPLELSIAPPYCTPGGMDVCTYSGPLGTQGVGLCRAAHKYCNLLGTAFGPCEGEVLPATETCSNTFDENCDGQAQEVCNCNTPCYSGPAGTVGVGVCRAGTIQCNLMGANPYCRNQKLPTPETCSTPEDDDCNGTASCSCNDGVSGKVACWPLDESSGTTCTDLIQGNKGTLLNGTARVAGVWGGALSFDGVDDYVLVPDAPELDFDTGDFSISFYVKTSQTGLPIFIDKRTESSGPARGYSVYASGGWLGFQMANGAGHTNFGINAYVADGLWHHVVITVDRDSTTGLSVYFDKTRRTVGNPTFRQGSLSNPHPFTLGRRSDNPGWPGYMSGSLDEVKLFNRVLTPTEIQSL
ncbi:MAG TPA: DNRLRE domain-containing protein [Archangium sp.]|nr:DNRLRE domain-containing protein [Archangium sp.]